MTGSHSVIRGAAAIGQGLAPAREARRIQAGEAIHVVGAGGAGASAAAWLAAAAGAAASGCDPGAPNLYTASLEHLGVPVAAAHDARHVTDARPRPARLAVTKALTSVQPDHPELLAARAADVPVEPWQQVVADAALTQGGHLVAVAGTHGKSTSSGWLVHLLAQAGRDPGAFVGALLPPELTGGPPGTARWGRGDVFVVEADEYAGNFDPYRPAVAVILNAEWDHPDVFVDRAAVVDAFEAWLRAPGADQRLAVVHAGDAGSARLLTRLADWGPRVVRVEPLPTENGADRPGPPERHQGPDGRGAAAVGYAWADGRLRLTGLPGLDGIVETSLQLAGRHNAANAACVAAAAALLGVDASAITAGLASFAGVGRRMDIRGEPGGVLVIDDYGHHPTAIRATLQATRERYPGRPVWIAHEPLTFHRAAALGDELAAALAEADHVVIADIWAGRDPDTSIASAAALAEAVSRLGGPAATAPGSVEATADHLAARVQPGEVVLVMGGGRSYVIADRLVRLLSDGGRG